MADVVYRAFDGTLFSSSEEAHSYEEAHANYRSLLGKLDEYLKNRTDLESRGVNRKRAELGEFFEFLRSGWTPGMQAGVNAKSRAKEKKKREPEVN